MHRTTQFPCPGLRAGPVRVLIHTPGRLLTRYRIFNFQKAYSILDELIIAGELQESSKKSVLRVVRTWCRRGILNVTRVCPGRTSGLDRGD